MKLWKLILRAIAVAAIALSLWGLVLLVEMFPKASKLTPALASEAPHFRSAFVIMNLVDALFLTTMIVIAARLLTAGQTAVRAYTALSMCLVVYAFAPGILWSPGPIGTTIATASGVGDMGLAPLLFYPTPFLFLIITVLLANLAGWRLKNEAT